MITLQETIDYCLSSVLLEIRGSFKWDEFKKLGSLEEKFNYASKNLQKLGQGSSRAAFLLSSRYVLKVAVPGSGRKGIGQNKSELEVYTNPASKNVVSKIYDADDRGWWLVSELVRPISSQDEFEKLTGVDWFMFKTLMNDPKRADEILEDEISERKAGIETWKRRGNDRKVRVQEKVLASVYKLKNSPLLRGALSLINDASIMPGDLKEIDHWGKTTDGRVILLDYGFTKDLAHLYRASHSAVTAKG